jgi:hypothetical protein
MTEIETDLYVDEFGKVESLEVDECNATCVRRNREEGRMVMCEFYRKGLHKEQCLREEFY